MRVKQIYRENFKGNYETCKFSLVTKIIYMHIYIYMYIKLYVYVYILIYISQLYTRYLLSLSSPNKYHINTGKTNLIQEYILDSVY